MSKKYAYLDTRVGDLLFRRGDSALVVERGKELVDWMPWPQGKRPSGWSGKLIPQDQDEMDLAIEAWFEFIEAESPPAVTL